MSEKTPIVVPVETKSREFHGKLWLAHNLLRSGHPVFFGEQGRMWDYCDLITPGVFLDKSVAATRLDWFKHLKKLGYTLASWDEEGLIFFNAWLYRELRFVPEAFDMLDAFFASGEVQRSAICEEYPQYHEQIALCGNPRFDFLRPDMRDFYKPSVEVLKERFGKMLLVNTNFAFYNHYKSEDELRDMLLRYPVGNDADYMEKWITMHREMHEAYLAMVPKLLEHFPEHTVVLRAHPSESQDPWRDLAKDHPRLHVDLSGNVHEWILASEAVIHFNCTTAVEAYHLDVPPIAYRPKRYPKYENFLPNALSINAFSLEELLEAVEGRATARERGVMWTREQQTHADQYLTGFNEASSAERISTSLIKLAEDFDGDKFTPWQRFFGELKHRWRIRLHAYRERGNNEDGYAKQKFSGLATEEIMETLDRISEVSGIKVKVRVEPYAKNLFWLRPELTE